VQINSEGSGDRKPAAGERYRSNTVKATVVKVAGH